MQNEDTRPKDRPLRDTKLEYIWRKGPRAIDGSCLGAVLGELGVETGENRAGKPRCRKRLTDREETAAKVYYRLEQTASRQQF